MDIVLIIPPYEKSLGGIQEIPQSQIYRFLGHISHSRDLLLLVGVCLRPLWVNTLLKNYWSNLNQFWYVASVGLGNKKLNGPTPKGANSGVESVKFMYFFENLLLYFEACFRQNKCIVIMTKEGSTKFAHQCVIKICLQTPLQL